MLLHWLSQQQDIDNSRLHAMHIHHGLHAGADQWSGQSQVFCAALGVPLRIVRVDVARQGGAGLEAAAREARYAAFAKAMNDDDILITAHHRDDQAETFLLRALRASGPDGLASMRPWRRFGPGWHWRPALNIPRSELLAYARKHGLEWLEDPGNSDTMFDRNFIRQRVIPLLRERWPHAEAAFARTASLTADAVDLLAVEDAHALTSARTTDAHVLSVDVLERLPVARRARVLRRWIGELGLPALPAEGVARIESQLLASRPDAQPEFVWGNTIIRRWRDMLHADLQRDPLPADWQAHWAGESPLLLPTGDWLQLVSLGAETAQVGTAMPKDCLPDHATVAYDQSVVVHARQGGERITLPGRDRSHTLKHVLQELGVPPWVRERLPLLSSSAGELLAIGDLACSAGFDAWLRQHDVCLQWTKGDC